MEITDNLMNGLETTISVFIPKRVSYDWTEVLSTNAIKAVPVSSFSHVPFSSNWKDLAVLGLKAEVELLEEGVMEVQNKKPYWIATVLQYAGYKAQIRYEGYEDNGRSDRWVNFCTKFEPIGYCRRSGLSLIPPLSIPSPSHSDDWRYHLLNTLPGALTVRRDHKEVFNTDLKCSIDVGSFHEVLDRTRVSHKRLAKVDKIVGRRVHLTYWDADDGFWCHEKSDVIRPLGWCNAVGHKIVAPENYDPPILSAHDMFEIIGNQNWFNSKVEVGMRLEAVDPLNLSQICAATVMTVLRCGYFMIQIDSVEPKREQDMYCYHIKSPLIFQCGFCNAHNIELEPPSDSNSNSPFSWDVYFEETGAIPLNIYREDFSTHGFEVDMKLEAVDVMTPNLIAVATVARVIGRLLRIHFDGWDETFDQWADAKSVDLFPIGWCEAVGYRLEPPKISRSHEEF